MGIGSNSYIETFPFIYTPLSHKPEAAIAYLLVLLIILSSENRVWVWDQQLLVHMSVPNVAAFVCELSISILIAHVFVWVKQTVNNQTDPRCHHSSSAAESTVIIRSLHPIMMPIPGQLCFPQDLTQQLAH